MPAQANAKAPLGTPVRHAFGQPVRLWVYVFAVLIAGLAVVFGPLRFAAAVSPQCPAIHGGDLPPRHRRGAGERGTAIRRTNVVLTLNDAVLIVAILGTSPFVTAIAMACSLG